MTGRVLVVDDDQSMCEMLADVIEDRGHQVRWFTTAEAALDTLDEDDFDVAVTDLQLAGESGLDFCRRALEKRPDLPVVVLTAFGSMDAAVGAIRAGAYDFINKPIDAGPLGLVIERAINHHRLRQEVGRLKEAAKAATLFESMIGESPAMKRVYDMLSRLQESDVAVLITGESGTGKELVAQALHEHSAYAEGPFVAINCAAMPVSLLESTLFGHVKGAFTDAKTARRGLFVEAHRGTLFLDEIGEMPIEMQAKLLRVLQERKVRPVGSNQLVSFDARIIAATSRDLEADIEDGRFREDLFYRIAVVVIAVPPLRRRGNDALLLAQHFLQRAAHRSGKDVVGLASDAAQKIVDYEWPGNVRELENVMERAVALTRLDKITVDVLPQKVVSYQSRQLVVVDDDPEMMPTLDELERRYIARVLEATGGNKTQAARVLGIDRRTLYRKLDAEAE